MYKEIALASVTSTDRGRHSRSYTKTNYMVAHFRQEGQVEIALS